MRKCKALPISFCRLNCKAFCLQSLCIYREGSSEHSQHLQSSCSLGLACTLGQGSLKSGLSKRMLLGTAVGSAQWLLTCLQLCWAKSRALCSSREARRCSRRWAEAIKFGSWTRWDHPIPLQPHTEPAQQNVLTHSQALAHGHVFPQEEEENHNSIPTCRQSFMLSLP